ncbi:MAG: MFS transporter [Paracoccaceae bacterium]|jgi:MFS family permease
MTVATFPSLIPVFQNIWGISNTEAGTISGIYFLGELLTVTVASATMDKWDSRPMFLVGLLAGTIAAAGFVFSDGILSASFWRFMQGAAVGMKYIPSLKILTDHLPKNTEAAAHHFTRQPSTSPLAHRSS